MIGELQHSNGRESTMLEEYLQIPMVPPQGILWFKRGEREGVFLQAPLEDNVPLPRMYCLTGVFSVSNVTAIWHSVLFKLQSLLQFFLRRQLLLFLKRSIHSCILKHHLYLNGNEDIPIINLLRFWIYINITNRRKVQTTEEKCSKHGQHVI